MMNETKNVFNSRARFFVIKSNSPENLLESQNHNAWATTAGPSRKLSYAFKTVENIILIFSINESGCFQGIARMESEPDPNYKVECFKQNQVYEQHSPKGTTIYQNQLKFMPNFKV